MHDLIDGFGRLAVFAPEDGLLLLYFVVILKQQQISFHQPLTQRNQFVNLTLQCRECFIGIRSGHGSGKVSGGVPMAVGGEGLSAQGGNGGVMVWLIANLRHQFRVHHFIGTIEYYNRPRRNAGQRSFTDQHAIVFCEFA